MLLHVQVPASHPVVQSLAAFSVEEFAAHSFRTTDFKAGSHFDVLEVWPMFSAWLVHYSLHPVKLGRAARNETRRREARRSQLQNHDSAGDWELFRAPSM